MLSFTGKDVTRAEILDAIFSNESDSGTNPRAYKYQPPYWIKGKKVVPRGTPGAKKVDDRAIGGYQIGKETFNTLKRANPVKYASVTHDDLRTDDMLGRMVANDLLDYNERQITGRGFAMRPEMYLASYNAGDGVYKKNTDISNEKTLDYMQKGMNFINERRSVNV